MVIFLYGLACYLVFFGTFLYAIGFTGNFLVPKGIDGGTPESFTLSLVINTALLGLFAIQHSVMARPGFKRWWTKFVPKSAERSTYVLVASGLLLLLFWQWCPMLDIVWKVENLLAKNIILGIFGLGWLIVFLSTCMINHFELFGLKQVFLHLKKKKADEYHFKKPGLYRYVRHPIMLGFVIAFWATPTMTVGHLVFAMATTVYILLGIWFEEKDLVAYFGEDYQEYRKEVSMLFPFPKKKKS